jgi:hypothetical protein
MEDYLIKADREFERFRRKQVAERIAAGLCIEHIRPRAFCSRRALQDSICAMHLEKAAARPKD